MTVVMTMKKIIGPDDTFRILLHISNTGVITVSFTVAWSGSESRRFPIRPIAIPPMIATSIFIVGDMPGINS